MTIDQLIEEYRKQAMIYGEAAESGDSRRGNKAQDELMRLRRALRQAGPEQAAKLLRLLDDDDFAVRLKAATDALRLSPADGERVLAALAQCPLPMVRHDAEMTLKLWRRGELTLSWWDE
jgi:hypothetical protein